jgi:hypothetical protein
LGVERDANSGESLSETFVISNGHQQVTVFSDVPLSLTYSLNSQPLSGTPPSRTYPIQQQAALAERFLQEHDLLDFGYRIESVVGSKAQDYSVRIVPMVSGLPLYENDPTNSRIWVVLDSQGDVWHLFYDTMVLKFITELPVRPAAEVWSQICGGGLQVGVLFTTYDSAGQIIPTVDGGMPFRRETSPTDISKAYSAG